MSHESHVLEKGIDKSFEKGLVSLSIILPTYNEADNIINVIGSVRSSLPQGLTAEVVVVDDSSPDDTGRIAEEYGKHLCKDLTFSVRVIHREAKTGLSSAIVRGIHSARGKTIVVMDSDLSHPPEVIPKMIEQLQADECDIVVASRYIRGGSIIGWPFKRRIISKGATKIAQYGLGVKGIKDPMSGFFAFKRHIVEGIDFDAIGYKILLEILVKAKKPAVREVPYTFTDRRAGVSKLGSTVILDYLDAVWRLYRYGKGFQQKNDRPSIRFFSKAARFATVGASGLGVNYGVSLLSINLFPSLWYLYSTLFGIAFSITSNFILNKIWTFEDRDFRPRTFIRQLGLFSGFSIFGAITQLGVLYFLIESYQSPYPLSLVVAVAAASIGNFLLNKRWTFNESLWG